ncbi:c-type cytochrome [Sulfitobacter sabulilitoris]|uniref:Cytochrome c family protein n=1 Tax=Sulfitobacter sabulilitoris TaxID=2562655 RepID=A0A5S3PFT9_9RHOB|nr:cytochrome c family protein [Sulfitobacter sabulilitoris]TMM52898.1 cytochrome c family protein [Sulfitobacter sabulilitoris]
MFDTMTFTKVASGLCGALLVFLLGKWAAEEMYHVEAHGEASYVIEVAEAESTEEVAGGPSFDEVLATADIDKGANVFRKCSACHKLEEGANGVGPYLYGVVGRDIAGADGYTSYSGALSEKEGEWSPENLNGFLEKPSDWAPGTSMGFAGLRKVEDRANLIAYLDSLDN